MSSKSDSNPAQIRGDIQSGLTGDKRPGADPAAAPMETDGEAAGDPLTPDQIVVARRSQTSGKPKDRSTEYGTAMRAQMGTELSTHKRSAILVVALVAAAVFVLIVAMALLLRAS